MTKKHTSASKKNAPSRKPAKTTKPASPKSSSKKTSSQTPVPLVWEKNISLFVNSVDISGDGQFVVGGNYNHIYGSRSAPPTAAPMSTVGTYLWDAKGNLLWKDEFQSTEGIHSVALSRDGTWAASVGWGANNVGFINAYNVATGTKTLIANPNIRFLQVALSGDGSSLVAGGDFIYLSQRSGANWSAPQVIPPSNVPGDDIVSVSISNDGQWIVAGTYKGFILLIKNQNGVLSAPVSWHSQGTIHWVAMAADGSGFAAAGSSGRAFYFDTNAFFNNSNAPTWQATQAGCTRCGCVAITDDGAYVSAVFNAGTGGKVFLYANQGSNPATPVWSAATQYDPNGTSMDASHKFVTVADGYVTGSNPTPGTFYLYDIAGNLKWKYSTAQMSWPMVIAANATAIAAGSDDSNVYYFSP
jgi:WD40 repeat protein